MPYQTINNKKLFYTESDCDSTSTSQTTTLLLHGLGSSSCFYSTIIPHLKDKTRCIALDYPGSGLSELGDEELGIESLARDVIALLKTLRISNVNIVAHSMSAIVASYLATYPPKTLPFTIDTITLLCPISPSPSLFSVFQSRISTIEASRTLETLANTIPTAATGSKSTPLHYAFIRSLILGTSVDGYIALCKVIMGAKKPEYDCISGTRLLIVAGKEDKTASLDGCQGILGEWGEKRKEMVVLERVGHWPCVEDAEGVVREVRKFLGE